MEEGSEIVVVRDKNAAPYRTLNKEIEDESETAAQRVIDYKVCDLLKIFVSFFTRITFDS